MASLWHHRIAISLFGEAEGPAIGVVLDHLPPGEYIALDQLARFMRRRSIPIPTENDNATLPSPADVPQILSGLVQNRTTGSPLCAFLNNPKTVEQADYQSMSRIARPGHADYTGAMRYRGFADVRSSGHLSERMTIPLCFAGAVCQQILERRGIYVGAQIASIHNIKDKLLSPTAVTKADLLAIRNKPFPVWDDRAGKRMIRDIQRAQEGGETLGGVIACYAVGVPAGVGSPIFEGIENTIAQLTFGIPGVRGLEFGAGFEAAKMTGSQHNDPFYVDDRGHVLTRSNHHGGVLGGISSGMPIVFRAAIKPAATIAQPQETVDYSAMTNEVLQTPQNGKTCLVPEALPAIEAAACIALVSHLLDYPNFV